MGSKIITIAQQKGGSGKTTLAANIAVYFSKNRKRVAVLDTDPQGSLGNWYIKRKENYGGSDSLIGFRTASAWGARYEARELLKDHEIVIIDTPPKMGVDGKPAIETADLIVVPITPSLVDLWAVEPTISMAKQDKKPFILVLNRAAMRTRLTHKIIREISGLGGITAKTHLCNRIIFAETMGEGYGVIEKKPKSLAALEITRLSKEILRQFQ